MVKSLAVVCTLLALGAVGVIASERFQDSPAAVESAQSIVTRSCATCHNDRTRSGNLSLQSFQLTSAGQQPEITEKMIRKLRAGLMPPAGSRRPDEAALSALADLLEAEADRRATEPAPGRRTFQR